MLQKILLQKPFVKAFRKHEDFSSLERLKAFLYITANNAALDFLKTEKRHNRIHEELKYSDQSTMEDAELAYIKTEAVRAVHQAIEELPPKSREVIRLLFIEGKTLPEVAAEMQLSYNTVQNHRARGLELLRMAIIKNKFVSPLGILLALSLLDTY